MKNTSNSLYFPSPALALAALVAALPLTANAQTWSGATNAGWGTTTNWSSTPTFSNTTDLIFNTSAVTTPLTTIGANRFARSITFGQDVDAAMLIGYRQFITSGNNQTLTLEADSGNASITVDSGSTGDITMGANPNVALAGGNLILSSNLNITHNGSGLLLFNRATTGNGRDITKTGAGTWQVNNNINSPGAINVNGGTMVANTFEAGDLNSATALNLGGGTLSILSANSNKNYTTVPVEVKTASSLSWTNSNSVTQTLTFSGTAGFLLSDNLTVRNLSTNTGLVNAITVSRNITGAGDMIVETYNNISSNSDNYALGRVLLSGDNSGWNGDLVISRGTASLSGNAVNAAGNGTIRIGTTSDAFGAGLTFFPTGAAASTVTYANNLIVSAGGFRSIKGGNTDHSIAFTNNVTLEGSLNIDHTLSSVRNIIFDGDISGAGGISVTRFGGSATTGVLFNGANTYLGTTTVANGAAIGGDGSIDGAITFEAGSSFIFNPVAPLTVGSVVEFNSFGVSNLIGLTVDTADATYSILSGAIGADIRTAGLLNFGAGAAVELAPGKLAYFELDSGNLNLVVGAPIPEPSAFAMIGGLVALGFVSSRRRRSV